MTSQFLGLSDRCLCAFMEVSGFLVLAPVVTPQPKKKKERETCRESSLIGSVDASSSAERGCECVCVLPFHTPNPLPLSQLPF